MRLSIAEASHEACPRFLDRVLAREKIWSLCLDGGWITWAEDSATVRAFWSVHDHALRYSFGSEQDWTTNLIQLQNFKDHWVPGMVREGDLVALNWDRIGAGLLVPAKQFEQEFSRFEPSWDMFLSYASEDLDAFVRPLATGLCRLGYRVWFDVRSDPMISTRPETDITSFLATSLRRAKAFVVVLSPISIKKRWPMEELRRILELVRSGSRLDLIVIWHELPRDLSALDSNVRDVVTLSKLELSSSIGTRELAKEISEDVESNPRLVTDVYDGHTVVDVAPERALVMVTNLAQGASLPIVFLYDFSASEVGIMDNPEEVFRPQSQESADLTEHSAVRFSYDGYLRFLLVNRKLCSPREIADRAILNVPPNRDFDRPVRPIYAADGITIATTDPGLLDEARVILSSERVSDGHRWRKIFRTTDGARVEYVRQE